MANRARGNEQWPGQDTANARFASIAGNDDEHEANNLGVERLTRASDCAAFEKDAAPLDYDIILREPVTQKDTGEILEWLGLDFGKHGAQGQHFHLSTREMRAYREHNRRRRIAWDSIPKATQSAINRYLEQAQ